MVGEEKGVVNIAKWRKVGVDHIVNQTQRHTALNLPLVHDLNSFIQRGQFRERFHLVNQAFTPGSFTCVSLSAVNSHHINLRLSLSLSLTLFFSLSLVGRAWGELNGRESRTVRAIALKSSLHCLSFFYSPGKAIRIGWL